MEDDQEENYKNYHIRLSMNMNRKEIIKTLIYDRERS